MENIVLLSWCTSGAQKELIVEVEDRKYSTSTITDGKRRGFAPGLRIVMAERLQPRCKDLATGARSSRPNFSPHRKQNESVRIEVFKKW